MNYQLGKFKRCFTLLVKFRPKLSDFPMKLPIYPMKYHSDVQLYLS